MDSDRRLTSALIDEETGLSVETVHTRGSCDEERILRCWKSLARNKNCRWWNFARKFGQRPGKWGFSWQRYYRRWIVGVPVRLGNKTTKFRWAHAGIPEKKSHVVRRTDCFFERCGIVHKTFVSTGTTVNAGEIGRGNVASPRTAQTWLHQTCSSFRDWKGSS